MVIDYVSLRGFRKHSKYSKSSEINHCLLPFPRANPFTYPSKQFFSCDLLGALISATSTNRNGKETVAYFPTAPVSISISLALITPLQLPAPTSVIVHHYDVRSPLEPNRLSNKLPIIDCVQRRIGHMKLLDYYFPAVTPIRPPARRAGRMCWCTPVLTRRARNRKCNNYRPTCLLDYFISAPLESVVAPLQQEREW